MWSVFLQQLAVVMELVSSAVLAVVIMVGPAQIATSVHRASFQPVSAHSSAPWKSAIPAPHVMEMGAVSVQMAVTGRRARTYALCVFMDSVMTGVKAMEAAFAAGVGKAATAMRPPTGMSPTGP